MHSTFFPMVIEMLIFKRYLITDGDTEFTYLI